MVTRKSSRPAASGLCKWQHRNGSVGKAAATRRFATARGIAPGNRRNIIPFPFEPQRGVLKSAPLRLKKRVDRARHAVPGAMLLAVAGWAFGPRSNAANCIILRRLFRGEAGLPVIRSSYRQGVVPRHSSRPTDLAKAGYHSEWPPSPWGSSAVE